MEKTIKIGFFTIDIVHNILVKKDLDEAKQFVLAAITAQTAAKKETLDKAIIMVNKTTSLQNLAMAVTNYMLAHPSENLKTVN